MAVPALTAHATIGTLPTATPANQAAQSAVGMSIDSAGKGYAVYRGIDKAVYLRTFYDAGAWSAQQSVGGVIIGAPSVATAAGNTATGNTVTVTARGTDNALWVRTRHNGTWGAWTSWGGVLSSSPSVTGGSDGRIDVFVRGTDNALWARTRTAGGSLTEWQGHGGRLTTAPAAVAVDDGSFEVLVAGTDHAVWWTSSLNGWKWSSLRGRTYSAPAVGFVPQTNGSVALVRGTDNALWANILGGGESGVWTKAGGTLIDGPTAAATRQPRIYVIVAIRSTDKAVWTTTDPAPGSWPSKFTRAWVPTSAT